MSSQPRFLLHMHILTTEIVVLTYVIHRSSAELGIEDLNPKWLQIFYDKWPYVKDIIPCKWCALLEHDDIASQKLALDSHPKATRATTDDHCLSTWTALGKTIGREMHVWSLWKSRNFCGYDQWKCMCDVQVLYVDLVRQIGVGVPSRDWGPKEGG